MSPVDRTITDEQLPAVLNFSPCRIHALSADDSLLFSPNVPSPAEAVVDSHISKQAFSVEDTPEVTSKRNHDLVDDEYHDLVDGEFVDENAGLSRAGCGATEFTELIVASDVRRVSDARLLTGFFC